MLSRSRALARASRSLYTTSKPHTLPRRTAICSVTPLYPALRLGGTRPFSVSSRAFQADPNNPEKKDSKKSGEPEDSEKQVGTPPPFEGFKIGPFHQLENAFQTYIVFHIFPGKPEEDIQREWNSLPTAEKVKIAGEAAKFFQATNHPLPSVIPPPLSEFKPVRYDQLHPDLKVWVNYLLESDEVPEGIEERWNKLSNEHKYDLVQSITKLAKFNEIRADPMGALRGWLGSMGSQGGNGADGKQGAGKDGKKDGSQGAGGAGGQGGYPFKLDLQTAVFLSFATWAFFKVISPGEVSREITWQEFRNTFLDKGLVEKLVVINRNKVKVYLYSDATAAAYPDSPVTSGNFFYYFSVGSVEAFERRLEDAQNELGIPSHERIPVAYKDEISWTGTILSFAPTLLVIGSIIFLSRRAGGGGQSGIFGIGKSRAKMFNEETGIKTKFKDVAGMDEAKVEIMEFVSFLKTPERFEKLGAKIPRGAILSGPPGTGKTLLAKATAGEAGVPFFSVSGSEFVEMFVGVGPSRVRDLFAKARKNTPCIIFVDEIDAIGKARSKSNFGGGNDERESTLNQLLTEMDGFNTQDQVVVLAGTNRADVLDKALMRPGRFDRHIVIDRPTMEGRKQIFQVHLKKIKTNEEMDFLSGKLAALTPGFAGADIANCVNEGALIAARQSAESVTLSHFEQAIERVIGGLEKKSLVLSPSEKRTVAYHEAGHAICGWYFEFADPLLKVSIIPRGSGALGYAQYLPAGEQYLMSVNQLMDRMAMTLGGRVSEELHFPTVTSGASDDFNKVTRMATAMVTKWGMSKEVGYLHFEDDEGKLQKPFSESTAQKIDSEVKKIVDEAYLKCKTLLTEKKHEIGLIAEELLKKEVLGREDMIRLLGKRPFADNQEFEKFFKPKETSAPPPFPTDIPPTTTETDNPTSPPA